jgi:DnaJ-class molecular chaperone
MSEFDYYQVLQLNRTATIDSINKAFRRLSLKYHPTKNPSDITVCSDQFNQICEAYEILSDFKSRTVYDKYGSEILSRGLHDTTEVSYPGYKYKRNAFEIFEKFYHEYLPYHEIFDDTSKLLHGSCFGYSFGGILNKERHFIPPKDLHITLDCSIAELYIGCIRTINYENKSKQLEIKPGFVDGHTVVLIEEISHGFDDIHRQIIVHIKQIPHSQCTRKGNDLIYKHNISLADALNASSVKHKTFDGRTLNISVDEIITPQSVKVVEGEGMPVYDPEEEKISVSNASRGKLFIIFNIEFPVNITEERKSRIVAVLNQ